MYTKGQAIDFIERVFGHGSLSNQGDNISVTCPICKEQKGIDYEKKKLVIRTDNFLSHCWVCGFKSKNLAKLIRRYHSEFLSEYVAKFLNEHQLADLDSEDGTVALPPKALCLPDDFELLALIQDDQSWQVQKSLEYLRSRGLGDERSLWTWKFGISRSEGNWRYRVIVPSFDEEGKLNYYTGRSILPKLRPKYFNPPVIREDIIFNELNIKWSEPLVIVEGPFDAMKAGNNATCLLGSTLNEDYHLFRKIAANMTPVYLALDPDAKKKQHEIARKMTEWCVDVKLVEIPNGYSDVGEMKPEEFTRLLETAIPWTMDYYTHLRIAEAFE